MPRPSLLPPTFLAVIGLCLAGCASATGPAPDGLETHQSVSPQRAEHQRKQRQRYIEGNYKRLYRPKTCRPTAGRNCADIPRTTISAR